MNLPEIVLTLVLIPLAIWGVRTLLDVKEAVGQLRIVLIGLDGQNGMRSVLNDLSEARTDHEHRLTTLETARSLS